MGAHEKFLFSIADKPKVEDSIKDIELLELINKASIITTFVSFLYTVFAAVVLKNIENAAVSASIGFIFLMVYGFYRYKKLEWLKLYIALVVPIWIFIDTISVGGDFSQSAAILAVLGLVYVFYEKKILLQRVLVVIILILFAITKLVEKYYGTIFESVDHPFDEILVLVISVIWLFSILGKHDREKNRLIHNLEQQNETLKATTVELERFTNIASHDLKSPLRNISSFLGLIERDLKKGDTTQLTQYLEFAKTGALQMNYLIQDILEVSNVNQNAHPEKSMVSLQQLLKNAIANLRLEIAEKNAVVEYADLPDYLCNGVELMLLFQNLLQNGIKYNTAAQPKIVVSSEKTMSHLKLHFIDNGIGIEPAYHDYVFEHFKRLHSTKDYMGTGLGLSLCRKIAQKHHGDILLNSELGKGSQFTLMLPANPAEKIKYEKKA